MAQRPYTPGEQPTGRPRKRWHVGECATARLDANSVRRNQLASGHPLADLESVTIKDEVDGVPRVQRVEVWFERAAIYRGRLWLVCPRCGTRRVHLYCLRTGVGCRSCLRIRYADRRSR